MINILFIPLFLLSAIAYSSLIQQSKKQIFTSNNQCPATDVVFDLQPGYSFKLANSSNDCQVYISETPFEEDEVEIVCGTQDKTRIVVDIHAPNEEYIAKLCLYHGGDAIADKTYSRLTNLQGNLLSKCQYDKDSQCTDPKYMNAGISLDKFAHYDIVLDPVDF